MSTKKIILSIIGLAVLSAVVIGLFMWYQPHREVKSKPGIPVTAVALYNAFITDSSQAGKLYINNIVTVSGQVKLISFNQQQQQVVLLRTASGDGSVNCTLEEKNVSLKPGDSITLKGICSGYNGDADMGVAGDVILVRCYISNNN